MSVYGIIAVCAGTCAIAVVVFLSKRRNKPSDKVEVSMENSSETTVASVNEEKSIIEDTEVTMPLVSFQPLSTLAEDEGKNLVEIKDQQLIGKIDSVIPGALQLAANAGSVFKYNQAVQSAGQLYQAVIPKGAALANSRDMGGAVRGFFHGSDGIRGHANLKPVDGNMGKGLASMNAVNAAMGVASMVVGQYYMSQINNRLESMAHDLEKVVDFNENEYSGKIVNLLIEVQKEASFQLETMENEELRNRKLIHLQSLEHECGELLEQANSALHGINRKRVNDYEQYNTMIPEANFWYQSQQTLLGLLSEIAELIFVMNLGAVSRESSYATYKAHYEQSHIALLRLNAWHRTNISRFEIDINGSRRKRQGFDDFIMKVPALFNGELRYHVMPNQVIKNIREQMKGGLSFSERETDLFQEDVRLICKEGKIYYLPQGEKSFSGEDCTYDC